MKARSVAAVAALVVLVGCRSNRPDENPHAVPESPPSPNAVRATWSELDQSLKETQQRVLGPTVGFALSNGIVGLGLYGAYPADSEGSEYDTLFLANRFTQEGVRQLVAMPNPIAACVTDHSGKQNLDAQASKLEFDFRTGVYRADYRYGDLNAMWQLVVPPGTSSFVERLEVKGKPGDSVPIDMDFGGTLKSYQRVVKSDGYEDGWKLGADGKGVLEVWHGFDATAVPETFAEASHRAQDWASSPLSPRIVIDGPVDDQQAVNSMLYHLRSGVNPNGPTGPFGLTNPKYGGRAFWDSDVWMFPALALLDPERAASIPRFRLDTRNAATDLACQWAKESRQQFEPSVTPYKFPWEADLEGRENAPGASRHQEHITADVALMIRQANALGLVSDSDALNTVKGCAQYLWHRADRLPSGQWGVLDTMSPDEFHTGDNDLYTNIAFEQVLKSGFPDRWKAWSFKRPKDATTFLTYDQDGLRGYKQAAALLAIWPLQDSACEKEAGLMLQRFAGKSTKSGPAMSTSVEALITARFGRADDAYLLWRDSWKRYTGRPLMMFSEAPNGRNAYFLTGAAGCLDALLYGLVGLRIDDHDPGQRSWKVALKGGFWLSCSPNLPQAWKSVTIDNLRVLNKRYRLRATGKAVSVTELKSPRP